MRAKPLRAAIAFVDCLRNRHPLPLAHLVETVRSRLHHSGARLHVLRVVIVRAYGIPLLMSKLQLDVLLRPLQLLQQRPVPLPGSECPVMRILYRILWGTKRFRLALK